MYRSIAHGLVVESPFPLPELPSADAGAHGRPADVRVTLGRVEPEPPVLAYDGCAFSAKAGEAKLFYDGVGTFRVTGGREVVIDKSVDADPPEVRFFLLSSALSVLMHQRGLLPLHANAVAIDGAAVAFSGFSGRGKSTMAATLCALGHPLVADDVVPVELTTDGGAIVYPGSSQMRLLPQSLNHLGESTMARSTLHRRSDKYAWHGAAVASGPVPLARVYILDEGDEISIEPLSAREAFGQLVAATYPVVARLLSAEGGTAAHFRRCVSLASRMTVARLRRPRSLALLADVARAVEEDVAQGVTV
jgi:hypothetical protein